MTSMLTFTPLILCPFFGTLFVQMPGTLYVSTDSDSNNPSKPSFLNLLSHDCTVFQCDFTIADMALKDLPN